MAWHRDAPLLANRAGNGLTWSTFSLELKQLLASTALSDAAQYSAHIFRIGATTVEGRALSNGSFRQPIAGTAIISKYTSARSLANSGN